MVRELRQDLALVGGLLVLFAVAGRLLGSAAPQSPPPDALAATVAPLPIGAEDLAAARAQVEQALSAYLDGGPDDALARLRPFLSADAQIRVPFVAQFAAVPRSRGFRPVSFQVSEPSAEGTAILVAADVAYVDAVGQRASLRWGFRLTRAGGGWGIQAIELWRGS